MTVYATVAAAHNAGKMLTQGDDRIANAYAVTVDEAGRLRVSLTDVDVAAYLELARRAAEPKTVFSKAPKKPKKEAKQKQYSTVEGPCRLVHSIAAHMVNATRQEILVACVAAGIAPNTARRQLSEFFKDKATN